MNQNPEQIARDAIDRQFIACGWVIQGIKQVLLYAGPGIAVKERPTDVGPADYILFVDKKPVAVIKAKRAGETDHPTAREERKAAYAKPTFLNSDPLPFVDESISDLFPVLPVTGLLNCQVIAINNLEQSFKDGRPKALIQKVFERKLNH